MAGSKANLDYWKKRLTRRRFRRSDGSTYQSPDYGIRLTLDGRRVHFNLESPNKEVAAQKAREIWEFYRANGIQAAIEEYKDDRRAKVENEDPTVGDLFKAHQELRLIRPKTLSTYCIKFRTIVAGIEKIPSGKARFDYQKGGHMNWKAKVECVSLKKITKDRILQWRAEYLEKAKRDPLSQQHAHKTVDSVLRNSRALFSKKALSAMSLEISENPFNGVPVGSSSTRRYRTQVDFKDLAVAAKKELQPPIPKLVPVAKQQEKLARFNAISKHQQFKILLLGLGCGLRRGEIDTLPWQHVDFQENQIFVDVTEFGETKSEESIRTIDVDPTIMEVFASYQKREQGGFVITSDVKPKAKSKYYHYRCSTHFRNLIAWLRSKGITRRNPLHELRKEYGSRVCQEFGIYAASRALGHTDISITAASYLDIKNRASIKIQGIS